MNESGHVFKKVRLYAYDSIRLRIQTSPINYGYDIQISSQTKREAKAKNVKPSSKVYHR